MSKGQVVVVLEAMKMEYPITAPAAGQVSTLCSVRAPKSLAQQHENSASLQAVELRQPAVIHARYLGPSLQQQLVCIRTALVRTEDRGLRPHCCTAGEGRAGGGLSAHAAGGHPGGDRAQRGVILLAYMDSNASVWMSYSLKRHGLGGMKHCGSAQVISGRSAGICSAQPAEDAGQLLNIQRGWYLLYQRSVC